MCEYRIQSRSLRCLTCSFCSGGSVLAILQSTQFDVVKNADLSVLVRGKDKADAMAAKGVKPILFESFDDHETIKEAASGHDGEN